MLVQEMEETFAEFLKLNESKNIMAVAGTPLTLAALWVMLDPVSPAWPDENTIINTNTDTETV